MKHAITSGVLLIAAVVVTGCVDDSSPAPTYYSSPAISSAPPADTNVSPQAAQAVKLLAATIATVSASEDNHDMRNGEGAGVEMKGVWVQRYEGNARRFAICEGFARAISAGKAFREGGPVFGASGSFEGCSEKTAGLFSNLSSNIEIRPTSPRKNDVFNFPAGFEVAGKCKAGYCLSLTIPSSKGVEHQEGDEWRFTVKDEATARNAVTAIKYLIEYNSR